MQPGKTCINMAAWASIGLMITACGGGGGGHVNSPWTKVLATAEADTANAIARDGNNSLYLAGMTWGTLGEDSAGKLDAVVVKYNSNGDKAWVRQFGTSQNDYANGVAVDQEGNVIVTGHTYGNLATTNPDAGGGYADIYAAKYDSTGNSLWTRQLASTGPSKNDYGYAVATDLNGNIYVAGATDGNLGGTSVGGWDMVLVKYDSAGNLLWTRQLGSTGNDFAMGVTVDPSGNVYLAGHSNGGLDGNANTGGSGQPDAVVVKYASDGTKQWTQQFGTAGWDAALAITFNPVSGEVLVTGDTSGALGGVNAGMYDLYVARLSTAGQLLGVQQYGTVWSEKGSAITVDANGYVYVAGGTESAVNGTYSGGNDVLLFKFASDLALQWSAQMGGTGNDIATGVVVDTGGNVYVAGYSNGTLDGHANKGSHDIFLLKTDVDGVKQ